MNIALVSKDKFLYNFIKSEFKIDVDILSFETLLNTDLTKYSIFIFDNIEINILKNLLQRINNELNLVINISNEKIDNIINIEQPFRINILKEHITSYINYFNKYFIQKGNIILNTKKDSLFIDNKLIQLTEKECQLIVLLIKKNRISRDELLKVICGYSESRAVDTLVYNIRFKLKNNDIDDFIICNNSYYELNI